MELGRTLWRLGDKDRALTELEAAMALDVEDINAHLQKVCLQKVSCCCMAMLWRTHAVHAAGTCLMPARVRMKVDAELLVKDLRRSIRSKAAPAHPSPLTSAQPAGEPAGFFPTPSIPPLVLLLSSATFQTHRVEPDSLCRQGRKPHLALASAAGSFWATAA